MKRLSVLPAAAAFALAGCAQMHQSGQPSAWGVPPTGAAVAGKVTGQAATLPGNVSGQVPPLGTPEVPAVPGVGGASVPTAMGQSIPGQVQAGGLVDVLAGQLGVSPQQAAGGAGAIFGLAEQRMSPAEFGRLSQAVPGMDSLLAAAPAVSSTSTSGLMGAAGSMMGSQAGMLGGLAPLVGSFQSLGLSPDMIGQFMPVVMQYVQQQGGAATMGLLQSALY